MVLQWALLFCLQFFFAVIRIDMKQVDFDKDLFENMLMQYTVFSGMMAVQIDKIRGIFRDFQEKVFWILDGIDESQSQSHQAEAFIAKSQHFYSRSVFMFLTREEGKPLLGTSLTQVAEFSMSDLDWNQCNTFIEKFPFTGAKADTKRELLINTLKKNATIK